MSKYKIQSLFTILFIMVYKCIYIIIHTVVARTYLRTFSILKTRIVFSLLLRTLKRSCFFIMKIVNEIVHYVAIFFFLQKYNE